MGEKVLIWFEFIKIQKRFFEKKYGTRKREQIEEELTLKAISFIRFLEQTKPT